MISVKISAFVLTIFMGLSAQAISLSSLFLFKSGRGNACRMLFESPKGLENPLKVSQLLKLKKLTPKNINVFYAEDKKIFNVYYNKKLVMHFDLFLSENVYPLTHPIHDDYQRKGIGTISYLLLARFVHTQYKMALASDPLSITKEAVAIWQRFHKLGLVTAYEGNFFFKRNIMQNHEQWEEIDEILRRSSLLSAP